MPAARSKNSLWSLLDEKTTRGRGTQTSDRELEDQSDKGDLFAAGVVIALSQTQVKMKI